MLGCAVLEGEGERSGGGGDSVSSNGGSSR